ncbi:MAG TPA: response regulator, partial [Rhodothermales bacterium]|nr:response regulator [Rhodothermales bacterium]
MAETVRLPESEVAPEKETLALLIVEDDEDDYFLTRTLLSRAPTLRFNVTWAATYEAGLDELVGDGYDMALVDYRLGAHNGLELLREVRTRGVRTPIILLTGQDDVETDVRAASAGAADYLVKGGTDAALLERSIRYARERTRHLAQIQRQADLLDKAQDAILAFRPDGTLRYVNQSVSRLTGFDLDELLTQGGLVFNFSDPPIEAVSRRLQAQGEWTGELNVKRKDGRVLTVESRWTLVRDSQGQPQSYLAILTDITERKQLEAQFLRSQRMESIGRLVGGIAHDLGNLLVPVLLGAKVLQSRLEGDEKAQRTLSMIQKSAQRGADMVKQVLAFARGVEGERVQLNPHSLVEEVEKIARETFGRAIEVRAAIAANLWQVVGDATQLQQVLMNLAVNARDAMPDGGVLAIEAENVRLDEQDAARMIEAHPGRYIRLGVSDTGHGIPPDVLDKIFEPFFTTKSVEKGTGLGLSTVYSIVKSHGGFVSVYSEPGQGTTFSVFLPAAESDAVVHEGGEGSGENIVMGNGECVLLVDDEPFILETATEILESHGYRTCTATNGREALDVFHEKRSEIRLVLTDLMMPEMDGVSLIRALRAEAPDLPIVAASGMMGEKADAVMSAGADGF